MATIFLSYSSKDKAFVREIGRRLENEGVSIWLDDAELNIGESLIDRIATAIESVDFVAAVISSNSIHSNWVQKELSLALTREIKGQNVIVLPLLIDDCEVPNFLKDKLYADFRKPDHREAAIQQVLLTLSRISGLQKLSSSSHKPAKSANQRTKNYIPKETKGIIAPRSNERNQKTPPKIGNVASSTLAQLPDPIRRYLEDYPMFNVPHNVNNSFVQTSEESFFGAARLIYQSLTIGQIVWATDNLNFSHSFAYNYWIEEGLEHLRINHEATSRGVGINRIFIVTKDEYINYRTALDEIGRLHVMAGTVPYVALYERLPPHCRYDFAIWGDMYVDEVIYDLRSNGIIDNYVHWSSNKMKQFRQKIDLIRNFVEPDWNITGRRENDFQLILEYAANLRQHPEIMRGALSKKYSSDTDEH